MLTVTALAVALGGAHAAPAQPKAAAPPPPPAASGPPNALQGFSQNREQPVKIQAASLEVRDKQKTATFAGDVHVVQGDTDLRCKTLVVYYEDDASKGGMPAEQPGPNGQQQIKRMEIKGGVVVTQKESTATGDNGVFDMKANTVTLNGNVVITRGPDVLRGQKLVVDLTSGVSRMEGGRVEGLFQSTPRGEGGGPGGLSLPGQKRAN
jgi:lipopolysaccharide export system protein LptA